MEQEWEDKVISNTESNCVGTKPKRRGAVLLLRGRHEGKYPEWNKMSDERLMKALHTLRDEERKLIYQHVFEERTFEEMSRLNGLSEERCKGIYYYAIRKIRKVMGGEN